MALESIPERAHEMGWTLCDPPGPVPIGTIVGDWLGQLGEEEGMGVEEEGDDSMDPRGTDPFILNGPEQPGEELRAFVRSELSAGKRLSSL